MINLIPEMPKNIFMIKKVSLVTGKIRKWNPKSVCYNFSMIDRSLITYDYLFISLFWTMIPMDTDFLLNLRSTIQIQTIKKKDCQNSDRKAEFHEMLVALTGIYSYI